MGHVVVQRRAEEGQPAGRGRRRAARQAEPARRHLRHAGEAAVQLADFEAGALAFGDGRAGIQHRVLRMRRGNGRGPGSRAAPPPRRRPRDGPSGPPACRPRAPRQAAQQDRRRPGSPSGWRPQLVIGVGDRPVAGPGVRDLLRRCTPASARPPGCAPRRRRRPTTARPIPPAPSAGVWPRYASIAFS